MRFDDQYYELPKRCECGSAYVDRSASRSLVDLQCSSLCGKNLLYTKCRYEDEQVGPCLLPDGHEGVHRDSNEEKRLLRLRAEIARLEAEVVQKVAATRSAR